MGGWFYSPARGAGLTILRNEISAGADAWSAPAFMKTNDSAISGGTVCGVPGASCTSGDWRQAYASYLVRVREGLRGGGRTAQLRGPGERDDDRAFLYLWGANASTTTVTGPNTGLVDVEGNTVASSGRLWAFASYSRFIRPGAVRIAATTSATGLEVTAFRNSNGSIAVIALNTARSQVATFSLRGLSGAQVTPYLTDTSHQLSAQSPSLVTFDIRS